ncbi:hypothetical protein QZH41_018890, partial [Actinostola sp. cb2023]
MAASSTGDVSVEIRGSEKEMQHGHQLNLGDRDPTQMNDHVRVFYQDVFAEPEGTHSIDGIWKTSFSSFVTTKYWCYRILTAIFGIPTAILCGCYFACLSFDYIWCIMPCLRGYLIELQCLECLPFCREGFKSPTCGQSKLKNITDIVMDFLTTNISHEYSITLLNNKSEVIDTDVSGDVHWLESVKSIKSLVCRIQQSFSRVMTGMVAIACVAVLVIAIYFGVRNHWQKEEEDTRKMYKFVENIIDILRKHHDACKSDKDLPPYLPIPHVRDMLIKPEERKTKAGIWHRASLFTGLNKTKMLARTRCCIDCHSFCFLAFENFQWAVNPPIISPTPCLKIRNMFDPDMEVDDRWHVIIQDAILEKCIDAGASIVHIAVDKSSSE